jgi:hypothetical protein
MVVSSKPNLALSYKLQATSQTKFFRAQGLWCGEEGIVFANASYSHSVIARLEEPWQSRNFRDNRLRAQEVWRASEPQDVSESQVADCQRQSVTERFPS